MNDKEAIECIKKLKEHCKSYGGGCEGCHLNGDKMCFVKGISGDFVHPCNWQIPTNKPELTDDEKVILRNLDKKFKWITANDNGEVQVYLCDIERSGSYWTPNDIGFKEGLFATKLNFPQLFKWCKWEDEPYLIEDLLKE